ncbi:cytochrome P450 [Arthrobacter sulfonylureivorans]|uniref:Cytochrome P450 n=1 Tax=Arthrobacter sulfonylureivorans TaxID=2486855 RepID=A0ABY3W6M2_9MICC|nr:cytochrome P450 [Arthrobacter sulfonylureivorans]UNK45939.1 cytochrome P450 [Arthrobacter sulfonylureivorans]
MVAVLQTSDIDLWSDEVLLDPYPVFTELREQAAAVRLEKNDVWVLTRYQEIREALGNWEAFSSTAVAFNPDMNGALIGTSLATDPPQHEALRSALTENLSPRALRKLKASIDQKADDLVAGVVERGSFDAISDLARELPLQVVLDLIGVQGDVRDKILDWGAAAFNVLGPMNERTAQNFPLAGELFHWATTLQREELVEGSMGRAIFDAGHRGEIPAANCGKIVHQYVAAGLDTTIAAIGNAIAAFGANPDQYELLRQDASLIPAAFNETLRYEALMHAQGRGTTKDVDVDGTIIPAGSQVALLFCAGNRDPRHYQDPDTFLVERNPIDHLSFGYGVHGCAGQGLARLEAFAVLDALRRRVKAFTVGEGVRKINNSSRGLDSLPVLEVVPA